MILLREKVKKNPRILQHTITSYVLTFTDTNDYVLETQTVSILSLSYIYNECRLNRMSLKMTAKKYSLIPQFVQFYTKCRLFVATRVLHFHSGIMTQVDISIIVPMFNASKWVSKCFKSILGRDVYAAIVFTRDHMVFFCQFEIYHPLEQTNLSRVPLKLQLGMIILATTPERLQNHS